MTDEVTAPSPKTFLVDPAAGSLFVDLEDMKMAVADPAVVKLDTRDVDEWVGTSSSPYGKDFAPGRAASPAPAGSSGTG